MLYLFGFVHHVQTASRVILTAELIQYQGLLDNPTRNPHALSDYSPETFFGRLVRASPTLDVKDPEVVLLAVVRECKIKVLCRFGLNVYYYHNEAQ